jgi:hypothetical protein
MLKIPCGWLSPEGELFRCCCFRHLACAEYIVWKYDWKQERRISRLLSDDFIFHRGFVKLSMSLGGVVLFPYSYVGLLHRNFVGKRMSYYQIKWFEDNYEYLSNTQKSLVDSQLVIEGHESSLLVSV